MRDLGFEADFERPWGSSYFTSFHLRTAKEEKRDLRWIPSRMYVIYI